jgi:putative PEP-CTERM system TPR-repeat lipoprotein
MFDLAVRRGLAMGLLVAFTVACGSDPQDYLASGDRFLGEQKYRDAIVQYRNAVEQDPTSGPARHKLAQALLLAGEPGPAMREFVRAADLLPDDSAVQLDATRALLRAEQFEDARTRAERVMAREPQNVDALILRAHATAGLKDFDAALEAIEDAVALDPSRSASYVRLGSLGSVMGREAVAEAAYKQAVAVSPEAPGPHLALANYYWRRGRTAEAEQAVRTAIRLDATNVKGNRALARLLLMTNRTAEAEAPLRLVAQHSGDRQDTLMLGDFLVGRKQFDEAVKVFEQLAQHETSAAAANARIAGIRYEQGNPAQAHALIDELLIKQPGNAELLVIKGRWLLIEKKLEESWARAQAAVAANPKLAAAHVLAGEVQVARRRLDEATAAFNEAVSVDPRALGARVELARLHLAAGRAQQAVDVAQAALSIQPTSGDAQFEVARALFALGDVTRADAELRRVLAVAAEYPDVQTLLGQIEHRRGNRAAARQAFERALALDSTSVEALTGLVTLDIGDKQIGQARRRVDAQLQQTPNSAPLLLLAARTYATAGDSGAAEATLRRAIDADPSFFPAYNVLGQFYVQQSKLDEARREYEALVAKRPTDVAAMTMVAMIHQVQGKPDEARKLYERILDTDATAAVASNNLAFMYAESNGNLDIALQLAQAAKASAPNDPDVNDTLGWVYYKRDLPKLAVEPLEHSVKTDPRNPVYQYHLGLVYGKLGDTERARTTLRQALSLEIDPATASDVKKALSELQSR